MNFKKIAIMTILGTLSAGAAVFAGSGQTSTVSIGYYQTYATGTTIQAWGPVTVSGYVNPTYSNNSVWYELHDKNGIYQQAKAQIGFSGTLFNASNVPTSDYHLDLNPDGPNYNGVVANGSAFNPVK